MAKKREFGEGPIFTITNYIMWFFGGNIYFMLCNIPFLFILLSYNGEVTAEYLVLLMLFSLPIGPAYTALLSVMGKLIREKDVNLTKDYFRAYKTNFLQSLFIWSMQVIVMSILVIDIRFFALKASGKYMIPVFYTFMMLDVVLGIYIYPIISRFYLKSLDIIKLSFYYLIKKLRVTLSSVGVFILAYLALNTKFVGTAFLFIVAIIAYGIMFFQNDMLKELQLKLNPESLEDERQPVEE